MIDEHVISGNYCSWRVLLLMGARRSGCSSDFSREQYHSSWQR